MTINAASGVTDTILGPGSAASLTTSGTVAFSGQFTVGSLTNGGALSFNNGTFTVTGSFGESSSSSNSFTVGSGALNIGGSLALNNTEIEVDSGAVLAISGNMTGGGSSQSGANVRGGTMTVSGTVTTGNTEYFASVGGKIQFASLAYGGQQITLSVNDSTSSIEIGTAGNAAAGSVTIDPGVTVTTYANITGTTIVNNGTVAVQSGTSSAINVNWLNGALTGSGSYQIGSNAELEIYGTVSAASTNTVAFTGTSGILNINSTALNSGVFKPVVSGFNSSDTIIYQGAATSANYANGTLTLLNGASTVATLSLTGVAAGSSFITTTVNRYGNSTTQINMLGAGDTATAPAGTSSADQYVWNGPIAGSWDVASNWQDTTTSANPATLAPGSNDAVTIAAGSAAADVITGKGNSSSLTLSGSVALSGQFTTGALTNNGSLHLNAGTTLTVTGNFSLNGSNFDTVSVGSGTLNIGTLSLNGTNSSFEVDSGGLLAVTGNIGGSGILQSGATVSGGTMTVGGTVTTYNGSYTASAGGKIRFAGLTQGGQYDGTSVTLTVSDSSSSIEIGTAGNAAAGSVTVDAGVTVSETGFISGVTIVNNGTMVVQSGTSSAYNMLWIGGNSNVANTLSGSGAFQIGSYAELVINAVSATSANTIAFIGTGGLLDINSTSINSGVFRPVISGFNASDAIDYEGAVTSASYSGGTLTLKNGTATVATLTLSGIAAGSSFIASPILGGKTQINLLGTGDTATAPAGTSAADQYTWNGPIAGSWDVASNWKDTTTNANPATLAPGSNNAVSIAGGSSITSVITGKGNSSSLTTTGAVALSGQFTTGALTDTGELSVDNGATLTVSGNLVTNGNLYSSSLTVVGGTLNVGGNLTHGAATEVEVDSGGVLAVSGNLSDAGSASRGFTTNGGTITVNGTVSTNASFFSAYAGGKIQFANLTYGGHRDDVSVSLSADSSSSIEIGTAGNAALGSITIDAGVTVTEFADFSASTIVNNGTVIIQDGTSSAISWVWFGGAMAGSGAYQIGNYAHLDVWNGVSSSSTNTIAFTGTNGVLSLYTTSLNSGVFIPVISGFAASDAIDINATVTSASYANGNLTLLNGSATVATLHLSGNYAGSTFVTTALGGNGTQITVTNSTSNHPTLAVTSIPNATRGQTLALSSLISISDPSHVGYQDLQLWDSNGTVAGGEFKINGTPQPAGQTINVSAANIANTEFDVGTAGGTDKLYAQLLLNDGTTTGWQTFTVTAPTVSPPTLSVTSDPTATRGQQINLSSLVSISDPNGVGYQKLELWDSKGTVGGGEFKIGGTAQPGGQTINVSPANVANTVFDVGTLGGTDTLYAQLVQNDGSLSGWKSFTVTAPAATPPTLSVTSNPAASRGQQLALSSLVTISDPSGVGYQMLELWDSNGTVGGGEFKIGGAAQSGGQTINVSPANVASTVFDVGTLGGTDTLYAQLVQSDGSLSGWQKFTVTAPTPALPTLSVTSNPSATRGQQIGLSSLVAISDPDGVGYQSLELWDSKGTVGGGEFKIAGTPQAGGQTIIVGPANIASTVFDVGTLGGTDTLYAQLVQSNGSLSGWKTFTVTAPAAAPPTLSVTSKPSATRGQQLSLASLVTISDPNAVGYQKLELWDSNGTAGGGQFVVNGAAQTGAHEIDVAPADVANTVFDVGTLGGTDTLWAQLAQSDGTVSGWQQFSVTAPKPSPPTLAVTSNGAASRGQHLALSSLVTISDPSNVGYQKLELWDSSGTPGGGQLVVNGQAQTGGHEIDVTPANVANTMFDVGTLGGTDTLWAQLMQNDGTLTGWKQFAVTAPKIAPPTLSVASNGSATRGQQLALSSLVTISDPNAVGYQKLELWDAKGTVHDGQFVVNGVAQTGGHEIDVTPANVANTFFDVGTLGGTDNLWAQLQQSDGSLSGWMQFSVTAPQIFLPSLSVMNDNSAVAGQSLALSTLVTISDPSALGYQKLELWDSNGTATGGQFVINGTAQSGGHEIDVAPADVAHTVFDVGTSGGTDNLWARLLQNDGSVTSWEQFSVAAAAPTGPTISGPVTASGAKGTGTFTVNLLQNATDNNALHVANLVWTDTGSGLPAGFTLSADGNSMMVDTNSLAYSNMTSTFSTHFAYGVVDSLGLQAQETATIAITPT